MLSQSTNSSLIDAALYGRTEDNTGAIEVVSSKDNDAFGGGGI